MKWGDIIIIVFLLGGIITIFNAMVSDSDMGDYYDEHAPYLNFSTRQAELAGDGQYSDFDTSISTQFEALTNETDSIQDQIQAITNNQIGLLAIPGAVLTTLRVIFTAISYTFTGGLTASLEQMFGLTEGTLLFINQIILWILIMVVVGAILRWKL